MLEAVLKAAKDATYNAMLTGVTTGGYKCAIKASPLDKLAEVIERNRPASTPGFQ